MRWPQARASSPLDQQHSCPPDDRWLWGYPALTNRAGARSGYLGEGLLAGGGLELVGGHVAKGAVQPGAVVPGDVLHGGAAGGRSGGPGLVVEALAFQGREERLGEGVVPALPGAAARQDDRQVVGESGVVATGVLATAVGMEHHPGCGIT